MTIDIYEVVKKLTGPITPVGESHTDDKRYENLKELTDLTEKLITDIVEIERDYRHNHQHSMKRASSFCKNFLEDNGLLQQE